MAFRFDKLTQKAQEAVQQAQEIAGQNGHQAVHPLHLLIALGREREGIVRPVLEKCGVQPDARRSTKRSASSPPFPRSPVSQPGMYISPALQPGLRSRLQRSRELQRRVRLDRASAARHRRTRNTIPPAAC